MTRARHVESSFLRQWEMASERGHTPACSVWVAAFRVAAPELRDRAGCEAGTVCGLAISWRRLSAASLGQDDIM